MRPIATFIVRTWRETTPDGAGAWRASASDVSTKEQFHFASADELHSFLREGAGRAASLRDAPARAAGAWTIGAAVSFWLAWALMPDAATNDAAHILRIVGLHGERVLASVALQLLSCAAFVPALLGIHASRLGRGRRLVAWGVGLMMVGAIGMAADAVFHLAAYAMSRTGAEAASVLPSLAWMQTRGLIFLVPLLIPFFVGALLLPLGLHRAGASSRPPLWTAAAAPIVLTVGLVLARLGAVPRHSVALAFLGFVAAGLIGVGLDLARSARPRRVSLRRPHGRSKT